MSFSLILAILFEGFGPTKWFEYSFITVLFSEVTLKLNAIFTFCLVAHKRLKYAKLIKLKEN